MTNAIRPRSFGGVVRRVRPVSSLVAVVWALVAALPLLWMFVSAFKTAHDLSTNMWGLPSHWTVSNFVSVWTGNLKDSPIHQATPLSAYVENSVVVAVSSLALTLGVAVPAAWVLARSSLRSRTRILSGYLLALAVPVQALLIPIWHAENVVGLVNTKPGLILPYVGTALPFAILLLTSYFRGFPRELEEVGRIDGLNTASIVVRVVLPLSKGPISAIAILLANGFWTDFLFALVLVPAPGKETLPVGVFQFMSTYSPSLNLLLAAISILAAPVLVVYLLFQRYITSAEFQLFK